MMLTMLPLPRIVCYVFTVNIRLTAMTTIIETTIRSFVARTAMRIGAYNRQWMKPLPAAHPFLSGMNAPIAEERTFNDLAVKGSIPAELDGRYIRIGPNPLGTPHAPSYHWFVGDGMVHGVRLKNGRALWYRNRWVRNGHVSAELGEPGTPGPRNGNLDTVNTNVIGHAGKTWAVVEAGSYPVRLDEELNCVAYDPFDGSLKGSFTAHPHLDPDTGELHAICYEGSNLNIVRHVVVNANGVVRREEPIPVQHGPMIHDCMITKQYVLVFDLPVTFSMNRLLRGFAFPYAWNDQHRARIGLLPREGRANDIIWCEVDACALFHPANAHEQADGTVVVDVCAHHELFNTSTMGPDSKTIAFERWTIDPVSRRTNRRVIDAAPQEFPRIDETLIGKPYRYAYTLALAERNAFSEASSCLYKHDLHAGTREVHDFGPNQVPGEFVFVPKAPAAATPNSGHGASTRTEDDGWLIGYVADSAGPSSALVILDALRFAAEPQAVVTIPGRIPNGFHGNWIST